MKNDSNNVKPISTAEAMRNARSIGMHISKGNSKIGKIPNWSLVPGRTCSECACKTCLKDGCYALKSYRAYPSCKIAWEENTTTAMLNMSAMEDALNVYFHSSKAPEFFRVHVAGDFFSESYAMMWARIAASAPSTKFLAFTKQFDNVRNVEFPANFTLILSHWVGTEIPADLKAKHHVAWCQDGTVKDIPADAIMCPGDCSKCNACWGLKRDTVFIKH